MPDGLDFIVHLAIVIGGLIHSWFLGAHHGGGVAPSVSAHVIGLLGGCEAGGTGGLGGAPVAGGGGGGSDSAALISFSCATVVGVWCDGGQQGASLSEGWLGGTESESVGGGGENAIGGGAIGG